MLFLVKLNLQQQKIHFEFFKLESSSISKSYICEVMMTIIFFKFSLLWNKKKQDKTSSNNLVLKKKKKTSSNHVYSIIKTVSSLPCQNI